MQSFIKSNEFNLENQTMNFNTPIKSEVTAENSAMMSNNSITSTSMCRKKLEFTLSKSAMGYADNSPNQKIKKHKQKHATMFDSDLIHSNSKREITTKSAIDNLASIVSSTEKVVEGQILCNSTSINNGIKYRGSFHTKTPSNTKRNARERKRVRTINDYFSQLQRYLPQTKANSHGTSTNGATTTSPNQQTAAQFGKTCTVPHYHMPMHNSKKLSKVETLKAAIEYIEYLQTFAPTHHYCRNGSVMMTPPSSTAQSSTSSSPSSLMSSPSSSLNSSLTSYSSTSSYSPSSTPINKSKNNLKISKTFGSDSIQPTVNSNLLGLGTQESSLSMDFAHINSNQHTQTNNYFQNNESNASTIQANYSANFQSNSSNETTNAQQQDLPSFQPNNNSYCMSNILNPIDFNASYNNLGKENSYSAYYYNNTNVGYPSYNQAHYSSQYSNGNYVCNNNSDFYPTYQPMVTETSSEARNMYNKSPYSTSSQYSPTIDTHTSNRSINQHLN